MRFGIIGTNWITDSFIKAGLQVNGFDINAVYSRSKDKADEFAVKYGVTNTYTSIEEMVKSDVIDAVYIASPNSFHAEQSIICMNNGKHVICEKPISSNAKELEHMIEVAKANGVLLMEAMKTSLLPNFKIVKENIGKIGKVRRAVFQFSQYSSRYDLYKEGKNPNTFNPEFSNGACMDLGIYCLCPAIHYFGMPNSIISSAIKLDTGVDGQGSIVMRYDDFEVLIIHSKIGQSFIPNEIQGEKGSIIINKISTMDDVKIMYLDGTEEVLSQKQCENTMMYEIEEFIATVNEGKLESQINTYEKSLQMIKLIDEYREHVGVKYPAD